MAAMLKVVPYGAAAVLEFDKSYAQAQLSDQTETVEQLDAYAQTGGNVDLRRFAENTLPRLQSELEHARRIAGQ